MNAKGFFKKIVAVTLAGTMIFGSAMVTMADSDSNNTQIVTQESALTNSHGINRKFIQGIRMYLMPRERLFRVIIGILRNLQIM